MCAVHNKHTIWRIQFCKCLHITACEAFLVFSITSFGVILFPLFEYLHPIGCWICASIITKPKVTSLWHGAKGFAHLLSISAYLSWCLGRSSDFEDVGFCTLNTVDPCWAWKVQQGKAFIKKRRPRRIKYGPWLNSADGIVSASSLRDDPLFKLAE